MAYMNEKMETLQYVAEQLANGSKGTQNYAGLRECTEECIHYLMASMFPNHIVAGGGSYELAGKAEIEFYLQQGIAMLRQCLGYVAPETAEDITLEMLKKLPEIQTLLYSDVQAAYEGDPAAKSLDEIMLTYPAFVAIGVYRLAHALLLLGVPLLPRMMTEYAHRETGIDIHPGATIGGRFFIDHGTGVVIGETTTIGENVKLYQHVTLGAKSFAVMEDGSLVKGIKRHPDIGNNVVIYAGATILGGDTVIGDGCVIGGNVWLTHSVKAGEKVTAKAADERKA